ncbi:UNVERIFIED_CONTAM: Kinesin-like protein kif24 [Siphonaria sp. JEL0065]|nr:Kinesin-like protein kif24 [Siphonaria sp. JEL0065]
MSIFASTLRTAGLDHYYENFTAFGIDSLQSLTLLTMQDYGVVGHLKNESDLNNPSPLQIQLIPQQRDMKPGMSFLPKPASVVPVNMLQKQNQQTSSLPNVSAPSDEPNFAKSATTQQRNSGVTAMRTASPIPTTNTGSKRDLDSEDSEDEAIKVKYSFSPNRNPKGPQPLLNAYGVPTSYSNAPQKSNSGPARIADLTDRIRVCVRKRPLNKKELRGNQVDVATVSDRRTLVVNEPKVKVDLTKYVEQHEFTFDEVFDCDANNDDVYRRSAFPLVEYIFTGGKATCFAYGQTGSGKTYTMLDETNGLYVKACRDIFKLLEKPEYQHLSAYVGFYEIYQSQLYDLLNGRKKLHAREDGKNNVVIAGLQEYEVNSVQKIMDVFNHGSNVRSTGATGANADSSRSHAIFQVVLKHKKSKKKVQGKLSFIDLAGSERGADRGETDQKTRMEGSEINKSLLALKECIRALDQDSRHTPFRQSKLTQVLKDSFIGNSRTCMIATISPSSGNSEHSLNTLRYAYRVKELKGDVQYQDEDEQNQEPLDGLYDEPDDSGGEDSDPLLIDSEFPPENLLDSDDGRNIYDSDADDNSPDDSSSNLAARNQKKTNVLSQLNNNRTVGAAAIATKTAPANFVSKLQPMRKPSDGSNSNIGSSPSITDSNVSGGTPPGFDELVNIHRQHLRLFAELSKTESKLIVSYSMKIKPDPSVSHEMYLRELEGIMAQKEQSIKDLQRQIAKCKLSK